jgi:DMSO/TMAO reductase YedYZ molybdopterin-dependent catalytic subunit
MDETERPAGEGVPETPAVTDGADTAKADATAEEAREAAAVGESSPLTPSLSRGERDEAPVEEGREAAVVGESAPLTPPLSRGEREKAPEKRRVSILERVREPEEIPIELPAAKVRARSRRDFFLFGAGALLAAGGIWWLLPDETKKNHLTPGLRDWLDSVEARLGADAARRERFLNRALTFDDDVAEALYSPDRSVRTYSKSQAEELRNNYNGATPGPAYISAWTLSVSGLASGRAESLTVADLLSRFPRHDQVTRLCCVEGWSAIAWWGGLRFADFLRAFPPAPGTRWARLDSSVNLDSAGNPEPYYVSIDLPTARHPQTLLATHLSGSPLPVEHGAPLRLLVPMKLGLKNIKAITAITYSTEEPADFWNERGYSKYDGL